MSRYLPLLISFAVSFLTAPFLRRLAVASGVVDHPEVRKFQKEPVPLLGGVAVFLGFLAALPHKCLSDYSILALLLGGTLIFIVSLLDDKYGLSARLRIAVQLTAAGILIFSGSRISFLPSNPLGDVAEVIITVLWILGITNSFNYLDGLDILCSGLGIISCGFFFIILLTTQQYYYAVLPLALVGACLGFIPHNLKKRKMFLGDAGSMFIGFMVSGIALLGNWASDDIIKVCVPILILGVPIFDMTFTTIMRYKEKKIKTIVQWLEYAGRDHFHHYLVDLGLHPRGAAFFIFAVNVSLGLSAVIIAKSDHPFYALLTILKSIITFGLISVLMILGRRLQKEHLVRERMGI